MLSAVAGSGSLDALLADKAFDVDRLLQDLDERGATSVIPPKTNRKIQRNYDVEGLCCTNRVNDVLPLSPYALSLQVL